ncbi:LPXTG cell wall anchor domain-containing protein [Enterococcus durans]|uniref:LPXTG cell wall anchor domain-containing protein n=1 Tax=Enterococcus durans TaxID=53345 RepID=UPI002330E479|nr:LPXTG cell wall anchor domain-containing protein [Enterococcus durans]MDB1652254.1 LPXTG cell wall anchor domain-containing protein [Enterococcus durans]MDB1655672.1 LPXTG cell wall anchor domain-containing protein [Enterococcus durans]MDB1662681.1 LPXTG cell wall anchor domain-containing protein [Enterococcus durans]MDB1667824.1 LPXTG cell wall anchor domain-containing protein [Enterococcus durans]MDB1670659.1 LPXTG cell wall anchor domain-containing protein [Enterococcus durans]
MKYLNVLFTSVVLASLAVPVDAAQVDEAAPQYPITIRSTEPGWANVNRITLQDIFLPTNSGIMKVAVGETITVNATVDYSGDLAPILQSSVLFEGVDPALTIGYDPSSLVINQRAASFSFTVTLNRPLTKPALFTVKVADGSPSDNQHLTPYSQRQTIEEASIDSGDEDLIEIPETDGNVGGNKPTIKPEEPDQEVTEPEEPGQGVTEPEEPGQEVTEPEEPDQEVTEPEEPDQEVTEPEEPDQEVTEPEEPGQEVTEPEEPGQEVTEPEEPVQEVTEPEEPGQEVTEPEEPGQEVTEPEEPVQEVTEPEEPRQEVTTPEGHGQEVTTPPQSETDDTPANETNREVPENTNHSKANSHGKNINNDIIKTQDFDRNTHANVKEVPRIRIDKNEKANDNSNENYRNEENPSLSDRQSTLPKTAEKSNLFFIPVGLVLLGFTILKLKRK